MNNKGNINSANQNKRKVLTFIKNSYIYKLLKKLFSVITTLLLIMLLTIGGLMFYFNIQGRAATKQGQQYVAPFGLYTIISGSMEPNIKVYDVVTAVQVDDLSKIKVGDVITFISTWDLNYGVTVTHRIVNIKKEANGDYAFTTKGDANEAIDGAYVTRENLIGKVLFRIPQLGRVQFFLATKIGWFIVIFVPAMAVIIWDIMKIFKLKVLRTNISTIKTTEEANRTYFDGDILDGRDLDEIDLQKTAIISKEVIVDNNEEELNTEVRKPIPKRKKNLTEGTVKRNKK